MKSVLSYLFLYLPLSICHARVSAAQDSLHLGKETALPFYTMPVQYCQLVQRKNNFRLSMHCLNEQTHAYAIVSSVCPQTNREAFCVKKKDRKNWTHTSIWHYTLYRCTDLPEQRFLFFIGVSIEKVSKLLQTLKKHFFHSLIILTLFCIRHPDLIESNVFLKFYSSFNSIWWLAVFFYLQIIL